MLNHILITLAVPILVCSQWQQSYQYQFWRPHGGLQGVQSYQPSQYQQPLQSYQGAPQQNYNPTFQQAPQQFQQQPYQPQPQQGYQQPQQQAYQPQPQPQPQSYQPQQPTIQQYQPQQAAPQQYQQQPQPQYQQQPQPQRVQQFSAPQQSYQAPQQVYQPQPQSQQYQSQGPAGGYNQGPPPPPQPQQYQQPQQVFQQPQQQYQPQQQQQQQQYQQPQPQPQPQPYQQQPQIQQYNAPHDQVFREQPVYQQQEKAYQQPQQFAPQSPPQQVSHNGQYTIEETVVEGPSTIGAGTSYIENVQKFQPQVALPRTPRVISNPPPSFEKSSPTIVRPLQQPRVRTQPVIVSRRIGGPPQPAPQFKVGPPPPRKIAPQVPVPKIKPASPKQSALSPVATATNANEVFLGCCKRKNVAKACERICQFDVLNKKTLTGMFLGTDACPQKHGLDLLSCAAQEENHTQCCIEMGVDTTSAGNKCLGFCNMTPGVTFQADVSMLPCWAVLNDIKACFKGKIELSLGH